MSTIMHFMDLKLIVLVTLFSVGHGIQCYNCTYSSVPAIFKGDKNCSEPNFASAYIVNCSSIYDQCAANILTGTNTNGNKGTVISRSCGLQVSGCLDGELAGFTGTLCVKTCGTKLCNTGNGSSELRPIPYIFVVVLGAMLQRVW